MSQNNNFKPYINPGKILPEATIKAIILGVFLAVILSAANAYLGLFAGMTVSASIPAAVMSMAILQLFKRHNILENNAVQTAASAGESLAAGVIFTFPALILMGYWKTFNYWETTLIALCGGVLGVLFTIPLRSALIVRQKLQFPEGIATSEVLKSGEKGDKSTKFLFIGGLIGALIKLTDSGFKLWKGILDTAAIVKHKLYLYFGMNLSPALIGVGYIVGIRIAILVFAGGVISWWFAIPIYAAINGIPDDSVPTELGYSIWSDQIRFLGVGAMIVGGFWALINLRKSIGSAFTEGIRLFKEKKEGKTVLRTETDMPIPYVITIIVLMIIPVFFIYLNEIGIVSISGFMAVIMVVAGFLFSAVAAYMAGLVGSSNNPISGVTIATILTSALILLSFLGTGSEKGPAAAIMIGAVVCCAAAIGGDNMQDLKAGHLLGATPKKLQVMQILGVVSAAFILPVVLDLLNIAYGFGPATEKNPDSLTAPQATLMQSVAEGVFGGGLPWNMVYIGMGIGVLIIISDKILEARNINFRIPVLAVAVGLYLPFELDSAIMLGGVLSWLTKRYFKRNKKSDVDISGSAANSAEKTGLLFASGLITGEALVGILLAIPIVLTKKADFLKIFKNEGPILIGLIVILAVCYWMYRSVVNTYKKTNK